MTIDAPNAWRLETPGPQSWSRSPHPDAANKYFMVSADCHANEPGDLWATRMAAFFGAVTTAGLMLTLVLARWWHAVLDNPGGFGREFRALRVGRTPLVVSAAVAAQAITPSTPSVAATPTAHTHMPVTIGHLRPKRSDNGPVQSWLAPQTNP